MQTHYLITSNYFPATKGELDPEHEDFINEGIFALGLADFLASKLADQGYPTKFRCQEDWGHWLELEHEGKFTLAVCCTSTQETFEEQSEFRVFLSPDKPIVRKLFKKISVEDDLNRLSNALNKIFEDSAEIENVRDETTS